MWKILATTSQIMERILKHSVGLFTILLFIIEVTNVHSASVTGEDETGVLGANVVTVTCAFSLDNGESAQTLTIRRRRQTESYTDLALFNIASNQSFYRDTAIQSRTTLILLEDSASIRFSIIECTDAATYECDLGFSKDALLDDVQDNMNLLVIAKPQVPAIQAAYNPSGQTFAEYQELEMRCEGDVGLPAGNFMWFGYREGNRQVDFTSLADPGQANTINTGSRYCAFRRTSTLKLNLTRDDDQLILRCVVNHTTLGDPPTPASQCSDETSCKQTQAINVEYPVRQQDIAISSNPSRNEYIVGSDVTLKCTVDGNPEPDFRWAKDGDESVTLEGEDTWILTNLQLGDGGVYRCFANNTVNGVVYNASKPININVVETTTTSTSTSTSPTTTEQTGGQTEPVKTGGGTDNNTTIIIVCVVIGILLIVAIIVTVIIIRKKRANKKDVEEPPEKPFNKNNLHMYNAKPDLVTDEKKQNYNYKNDDGLTYADLKFDPKPRSRRPVALADNMTDYADIAIPQV